jgi:protein-S-isoprenylcysteine O-methyltransferase Ste14
VGVDRDSGTMGPWLSSAAEPAVEVRCGGNEIARQTGMQARALSNGPGAPLPPTLVFAGGFVIGWLIDTAIPFPLVADTSAAWQMDLGVFLLAIGVAIFLWGLVTFASVRTGIMLQEPARQLVIAGPYRFSRNPQYVGFSAGYLGLALLTNTWWPVVVLPFVIAATTVGVIAREERYLRAAFGQEYEGYCQRVGRWM